MLGVDASDTRLVRFATYIEYARRGYCGGSFVTIVALVTFVARVVAILARFVI